MNIDEAIRSQLDLIIRKLDLSDVYDPDKQLKEIANAKSLIDHLATIILTKKAGATEW